MAKRLKKKKAPNPKSIGWTMEDDENIFSKVHS